MKKEAKFSIKKKLLIIFFSYIIYKFLLDIIYIKWVHPIFGYTGLELNIKINKIILSYIILFIISIFIPYGSKRLSFMILQLHYIIIIIPLLSMYGLTNQSTLFLSMVVSCFLLQIFIVKFYKRVHLFKIKNAKVLLWTLLFSLTFVTYLYILLTRNISLNAFDLTNIYNIRSEQANTFGIMGYLITWQFRIINPFLLVYCFMIKKYFYSFIVILMQIMIYMVNPRKEVILALGLIFMVIFFVKYIKYFENIFIRLIIIVMGVTIIIYEIFSEIMAFAILPVRLLFVPAQIKFLHFEFFSVNEKLWYSEGLLGKILGVEYPYPVASGFLVDKATNNANTGYIAYAYDNAGFFGMIIMSVLFSLILLLLDSLVIKENKIVIFSILIYPMIILNDSDLLTLLLTGGLFLLIIILFCFSNLSDRNGDIKTNEIYK